MIMEENTKKKEIVKELQDYLDEYNYITLNKNAIPNDTLPPGQASGVRIGTPAMVTKGWRERDFLYCANEINNAILKLSNRKAERTLDKYFKNITEAKEYWKKAAILEDKPVL